MSSSPQDLYARLLSSRRGYPLWTPEPSNELLLVRKEGLGIGDIGVIHDDGGFDALFNICLPRDHLFHRRHSVPEGFISINPDELDIRTTADAEDPKSVIPSSVTRVETASETPQSGQWNTQSYKFNVSPDECALLILPKGAERSDLLNDDLFLEHAKKHGLEWYNYAVNRRRRRICHDSLYLITGVHKTSFWSVAAFETSAGNEHHTANFKYAETGSTSPAYMYSWEATRTFDRRAGPRVDLGIPNQAVFIRGLKIMLRNGYLSRWIAVKADAQSTLPSSAKMSDSILGNFWPLGNSNLSWLPSNSGNNVPQATSHNEGGADVPIEEWLQSNIPEHGGHDDMYVEIHSIPGIHPAFHPSDAINQYLLRKEPSANIAITHDNHWISMLEEGLLTLEELAQESTLEKVLSQRYRIVSLEGIVHLERKGTVVVNGGTFETFERATISGTNTLSDDMSYAATQEDSEQVNKQSPLTNTSKMDSWTEADLQGIQDISSNSMARPNHLNTRANMQDIVPDRLLPSPHHPHSSSELRSSSRRALTTALELAREAVQLDTANDDPHAAVIAYGRSVTLLSEVMERVRRGEDTSDGHRMNRQRHSDVAQEEEVRRLKSIHDTYADRMNILSLIHSIPPIPPHSPSSVYAPSSSTRSTQLPSSSTSLSQSSDSHTSSSSATEHTQDDPHYLALNDDFNDGQEVHGGVGSAMLNAAHLSCDSSSSSLSQQPYATSMDMDMSPSSKQATLDRSSTLPANHTQHQPPVVGRLRAASVLPPAVLLPVSSSPPPPPDPSLSYNSAVPSLQTARFLEVTRLHRNSGY